MPTDERKHQTSKTQQRRLERHKRREQMLEDVVGGVNRAIIAQRHGVSLKTVQREVDRALDARRLHTPERHLRLQTERLERALQVLDHALDSGDVGAVAPMLRVIERLDLYQGLAARDLAPLALPPAPPLALTSDRSENEG